MNDVVERELKKQHLSPSCREQIVFQSSAGWECNDFLAPVSRLGAISCCETSNLAPEVHLLSAPAGVARTFQGIRPQIPKGKRRREDLLVLAVAEPLHQRGAKRAAGILWQGTLYEGARAAENRAVAIRLGEIGELVVQLGPRDSSESGRLLDKSVRVNLERMVGQRVELAQSVLYQTGDPEEWNLEYYGHCRVGRAAFGAKRLPDSWVRRCNSMDEVWVPSTFILENFLEAGVVAERLRVVRTGVGTRTIQPGLERLEIPLRRKFQFLTFTDLKERRGTDVLLRAYLEEFRATDDVGLIVAIPESTLGRIDAEAKVSYFIEKQLGIRLEDSGQVTLVDLPSLEAERARLYASANAFVAPARASAWGRSLMEAQAAGLLVIATRWGGHLELLDDENAFLVDVEKVVAAAADEELYAGSCWAEPSVEDLRRAIRRAVSDRGVAQSRAMRGREDVVTQRDWDVVIKDWVNGFRQLLG